MKKRKLQIFGFVILSALMILCLSLFAFNPSSLNYSHAETANISVEIVNAQSGAAADYTTSFNGNIVLYIMVKNPQKQRVWAVETKLYYNNTVFTYVSDSSTIEPSRWKDSSDITENKSGSYLKIGASDAGSNVITDDFKLATLTFSVSNPSATPSEGNGYKFYFDEELIVSDDSGEALSVEPIETDFTIAFREQSNDTSLRSGISVKASGSEVGSYDAATRTYIATVPFKTTSVTIAATTNDSHATISGTGNWTLQAGQLNTKTITVTAENKTTLTYTIKITREAGKTDSSIGSLVLTDASGKQIALTQNDKTFTATINSTNMTGLKLTATANDSDATVTINSKSPTNYALSLNIGSNTIPVKVTAQNGTTITNYSVVITVNYIPSSDASIKGSISVKAGGVEVGSYNAATKTYIASVDNSVDTVQISLEANDSKATVDGDGTWALVEGENTKVVTITAENDTTKTTYTITINRATKVVETGLGLSSLTVKDASGTSIALAKNGNNYTAEIDISNSTGLTLTVVTEDANAIVKIDDQAVSTLQLELTKGTNSFDIKVYSQDESKSAAYTITITVTQQTQIDPVDPEDPNYVSIMRYIKFGGDFNYTLTKYDFLDSSTDSMLGTIKTTKDNVTFHLDFSSNIMLTPVYGTTDAGEVSTLTNGYKRVTFTSKDIKGDSNYIAFKITDTDSGTSRIYIIKIVEDDKNIPQIVQICIIAVILIEIILIVAIIVKIKKIKDDLRRDEISGRAK